MKRIALAAIAAVAMLAGTAAGITSPAFAGTSLLVESATDLNTSAETITLPLHQGTHDGAPVWYVITDSSSQSDARSRGVNWSPKLSNALGTDAVQDAGIDGGGVDFPGTVDFTPARVVVPNPTTAFPPDVAEPGSIGDDLYSPLITVGDGIVLNAPQVANASGLHDRVVSIDYANHRVTLKLTEGRYHGKRILYITFDASARDIAALEVGTFAPNLNASPGIGSSDPQTSSRAAIVPVVNGPTGADNPERQGLVSALMGEGAPLNVTEVHPRNSGEIPLYSPLWDVHPAVWTDDAIARGLRTRLNHHEDVARAFEEGLIVSGGGGPANPVLGGLQAAGIVVNCPVIVLFD